MPSNLKDTRSPRIEAWKSKYSAVLMFAREHGHLKIPWNDVRYDGLPGWLRQQFMRTRLSEEEAKLLDDLKPYRDDRAIEQRRWEDWDRMYRRLMKFHEENGHFVVPVEEDKPLHNWISNQRQKFRRNSLQEEQKRKLEDSGFPLEAGKRLCKKNKYTQKQIDDWNRMFECLEQFYLEFGHCLVPPKYEKNQHLPRWLKRQRITYHQGSMDEKRRARLEKLNFPWSLKGVLRS